MQIPMVCTGYGLDGTVLQTTEKRPLQPPASIRKRQAQNGKHKLGTRWKSENGNGENRKRKHKKTDAASRRTHKSPPKYPVTRGHVPMRPAAVSR